MFARYINLHMKSFIKPKINDAVCIIIELISRITGKIFNPKRLSWETNVQLGVIRNCDSRC